jgi:hypothetical protein
MDQDRREKARTEQGDIPPPTNGHVEGRVIGGPIATESMRADREAADNRVTRLTDRVKHFEESCADLEQRLADARQQRNGLEEHERGWPLVVVALLGLITVGLEYVPAKLFTEIFASAEDWVRATLTWTFTVVGVLLAVVLGEMLRGYRRPEPRTALAQLFVVLLIVTTLAYLYFGYELRMAWTKTEGSAINLNPIQESLALVCIAVVGILLTVVSACQRESLASFHAGWKIATLRRKLADDDARLNKYRQDLANARKATGGS